MPKRLNGKFFKGQDERCTNWKTYIRRHDNCIEIFFLSIYVLIQLSLIRFFPEFITSIHILVLLFILSLERIILRCKNKENMEEKREEIGKKVGILREFYIKEREELLEKIKKLES